MNVRGTDYLFIALGIGALYVIWKSTQAASAAVASVAQIPGAVGTSIGGALFDWTHPYDPRTDTFYVVNFPDGTRHAVQASTVAADGSFNYAGTDYVIKDDAAGKHWAIPA